MIARHCTTAQLEQAMADINGRKYQGNVAFRDINPKGRNIQFTLQVHGHDRPGYRRGWPHDGKLGKRMHYACWHVHGHFFDALLRVNPEAVIISSSRVHDTGKLKITKDGGNWQDYNLGTPSYPYMASAACDCEA